MAVSRADSLLYSFKKHHQRTCEILDTSTVTLNKFTYELYAKGLIDRTTKRFVIREGGYIAAKDLVDRLMIKMKDSPQCIETVLALMEDIILLEDVARNIREEAEKLRYEEVEFQSASTPFYSIFQSLFAPLSTQAVFPASSAQIFEADQQPSTTSLLSIDTRQPKSVSSSCKSVFDLCTTVSPTSPSIDYPDYGISIDIEHSSLHPTSYYIANMQVQVYTYTNRQQQFTFPTLYEPISAIYKISIDHEYYPSIHTMVLRILHFADPDNVEQLEQLTFVRLSDYFQSHFHVVPGGIFKKGDPFGEIKVQNASLWAICRKVRDMIIRPSYRGVVRYKQKSSCLWAMYLLVSRYEPGPFFALNKYMEQENWSTGTSCNPNFVFKFNETRTLKITTHEEMDEYCTVRCRNSGWTLGMEVTEISQERADDFYDASYQIPEKCELTIDTNYTNDQQHQREDGGGVVHIPLKDLPMVILNGIESSTTHIRINPPIEDSSPRGQNDSTPCNQQVNMIINSGAQVEFNAALNTRSNSEAIESSGLRLRHQPDTNTAISSSNNTESVKCGSAVTLPKLNTWVWCIGHELLISVIFILVLLCVIVYIYLTLRRETK